VSAPSNILQKSDVFISSVDINEFKQLITDNNLQLKKQYNPQKPVFKLIAEKATFIDEILKSCWQHILGDQATELSLLAVGGYGRRELFPHSDIDILVLLNTDDCTDFQERLASFFTFLWDIGLKPGQSVRTINECIEEAKNDQTIMTSLLELRLIDGNEYLYKEIKQVIRSDKIWPSEQFFQAKMAEQNQRYAKFHDTAYNLEPNIKEGPGGLRDMQVIAWVFKRHYNSATLRELIKYDFLPESEYVELKSAQQTLWRIRYALHLLTGRDENRLLFDYQRELAEWFGFTDAKQNHDVEQFMQHYYKTVVGLERLNEMLLQLFRERFISNECKTIPINENFNSVCGYVEAANDNVFKQRPLALLEIFLLMQQKPKLKGVRATTIRLIRKNLTLIDDDFRNDKQAQHLFIEIFKQPVGVTHQLRRMNRYGILAAYLPCFANIVARMQYDLFHIYTVDEHTLFVIRNLRRFSIDKHNDELPFCNNVFLRIAKPELLYLAALYHDIAKGKGGDHSQIGEKIAKDFCVNHGLSKHDTKLITWLVRNHLIMSMTAQRKDISDPEVIHEFATLVKNAEHLNYLYLLTIADIRSTNPKLWNSWKDSLLKELYSATLVAIQRGLQTPATLEERINETKQDATNALLHLGIIQTTIDNSWQQKSDDYFLKYTADEIVWHTIAIASCQEKDLPLVLLRPQTQRGSAEIFIFAKNQDYIFSVSTATLDQLGLSILDARIVTTNDQFALNSFQILEQSGDQIADFYRENHICTVLRRNLLNQSVNQQKNINRESRQARNFPITTEINFHEDPHNRHTILELISTDRVGLLSTIGQVFREQQIILHSAKITTIGSRVEDIFCITDKQLKPLSDQEKQRLLNEKIIKTLEQDAT
jgi:[protein-PII] uridylyltransferase